MKTHGSINYNAGKWEIECPPHIRLRLKSLFPRLDKSQYGTMTVADTEEACADLNWFMQRYPMRMDDAHRDHLTRRSDNHARVLLEVDEIVSGTYVPREVQLAPGESLRPYQAQAVALLMKRKGLLCADPVGLGKTLVGIGAMAEAGTLPAMVCCQPHLMKQWRDQIKRFLPNLSTHTIKGRSPYLLPHADVLIMSYSRVMGWGDFLPGRVKMCVFDEIQELRSSDSHKYAAAKAIADQADYRLGLSGTPLVNYAGDIFNVLQVTSPGSLGTFDEFKREWCRYWGANYILDDPTAFGEYLRESGLMIRRTRKEVGRELPQGEPIVIPVDHDEGELAKIDQVATELAHRILSGTNLFTDRGEAAREFDMRMRQATGIAKAPAAAAFVRMLVESGEKVLLGAWHREVWQIIAEHLKDLKVYFYTGTESVTQKDKAKEAMISGDGQVLCISLQSGVGLDGLQGHVNTVVIAELAWNSATHDQIIGRVKRDGMGESAQAFFLVSDAGSDPTIANIVGLKRDQGTRMLDPNALQLEVVDEAGHGRVAQLARDYLERKGHKNAEAD